MVTRQFHLSGFNRIAVRFAMEIEIAKSDIYTVTISGKDTLMDNIDVYTEGDKLVLGYRLNLLSFFTAPFTRASAKITMPDLSELDIAMAAHARISGFNSSGDLKINVAGASKIEIDDLSAENLKWDLSGASRIDGEVEVSGYTEIKIAGASHLKLSGKSKDLKINAAGASRLELRDFQSENASICLAGASHSQVNVNGKLDVSLEGASKLEYYGHVAMGLIKVAGASSLKHG